MEKFKNNFKEIIILLLIILLFAGLAYMRYSFYRHKKEILQEYKDQIAAQPVAEVDSPKQSLWQRVKNFAKEKINSDGSLEKKARDNENTLIEFNVSSEYNSFIFDDVLYMYDGEQTGANVIVVLDRMISDASDDYYSKPKLTVRNIGGISGTFSEDGAYISNIENVKSKIDSGAKYNVSFGYNKLKTYANEVIIEKI